MNKLVHIQFETLSRDNHQVLSGAHFSMPFHISLAFFTPLSALKELVEQRL